MKYVNPCFYSFLTVYKPSQQNGQTHSNNSLAFADELFDCVWPFCGVGSLSVKNFAIKTWC